MTKTRIGIVGYGNIGRGAEKAVNASLDMELIAIFTRRNPTSLTTCTPTAKVLHIDDAISMKGEIDVMLLCGGSATDLPEQGPQFAAHFNTVDTFDTHAKISTYFKAVDSVATSTTAIISVGWDPGLFSMIRMLSGAILPDGKDYTFWGKGVSQGHSDALRRIEGVADAIQYTVPVEQAITDVRDGKQPELTTRQKHLRECFVVAKENANKELIEQEIKTMPNYFIDYDTTVHFISLEELKQNHAKMSHGGQVLRSGQTDHNKHVIEFSLTLESNPEFTASVVVAYARAAMRMSAEGLTGAKTVFDVPLSYLSLLDDETLQATLL